MEKTIIFKKFNEKHPYLYEIFFTIIVSAFAIIVFPLFNISINKNGIYPVLALLLVRLLTIKKRKKKNN